MDLKEIGRGNVECVHLATDRDQCRALVSRVMNLRVPQKVRNFLLLRKIISFSRFIRGVN